MPRKAAKDRQKPSSTLRTPEPVQSRVIARHFSGRSNRKIAADEGLDPDTVSRILSQPEVGQKREEYRAQVFGLIPKSIRVYGEILNSDDLRTKAAIATKVLEGCDILLPKGRVEETPPPPDPRQRKWLAYGQMMEMALTKHQIYGNILPPGYEGFEEEAKLKLEDPSPVPRPDR